MLHSEGNSCQSASLQHECCSIACSIANFIAVLLVVLLNFAHPSFVALHCHLHGDDEHFVQA